MKLKPIHIFDLNGTLIAKDLGPTCEKYAREHIFSHLFQPLLEMNDSDWNARFPEAVEKGLSQKIVYDRVLEIIANPPKFTKAREVYYDIIESDIRRGRIDIGIEEDVLNPESVLMKLRNQQANTFLLSRGTRSVIDALLDGVVGLRECFDMFDSTITYGNTKTVDTYMMLIKFLKENGYAVVALYEDELAPLAEMYKVGCMISKNESIEFPFKLFWINRENSDPVILSKFVDREMVDDFMKRVEIHNNLLFNPI